MKPNSLPLPNSAHYKAQMPKGRTVTKLKPRNDEQHEVTATELANALDLLRIPEGDVNPKHRSLVLGYAFLHNAQLQGKAALRHVKDEQAKRSLNACLEFVDMAIKRWPIKVLGK